METLTAHAVMRMAQRGFRNEDIDLVSMLGTKVEDGYLLCQRDCDAFVRGMKHLIGRVERLRGTRIVTDEAVVVTAYRASRRRTRRLLRAVPDRDMA